MMPPPEVTLDTRETELIKQIPSAKVAQLPAGDVIIGSPEDPIIVIERKTLADFAASIKDGRYAEQKLRLIENYVKRGIHVLYIIEGPKIPAKVNGISKTILNSAMLSSIFRDDIKIMRTDSPADTAEVIERLAARWEEFAKGKKEVDYTSTIKVVKRDNVTPQNALVFQLAQIPGVSPQIAQAIAKRYKTMHILCKSLENRKTLVGLNINESRKIGPKVAANVYEYLCLLGDDSHID